MSERSVRRPVTVLQRLAELRAAVRRVALWQGALWFAAAVAAVAIATFALDRVLDFPVALRALLVALSALGLAAIAWRVWLRPLASAAQLDDDAAALLVERHFPLHDRLISAVQLARQAEREQPGWSVVLVDRLVQGVEQEAAQLPFERALDRRGLRRAGAIFALVVLLLGLGVWVRPGEARIWAERMLLLRDTPWPRAVALRIRTEPPARVVAIGDDLRVLAERVRGNPERVWLEPEFLQEGLRDPLPMVEARGRWQAVLENVTEPLRFRVRGGDFRSRWYRVEVRPRPQIETLRVWVDYPDYTGLADTPADEPLEDGNLKVPAGTRLRFEARANEPLRAATLVFTRPEAVQGSGPAQLASDGDDGGSRLVRGEFEVRDGTGWSIRLTSIDGFESARVAQWTLRVVKDRLPEIRLTRPGRNLEVTPQAQVPFEASVRDDYGLEAAALVYAVFRGGEAGDAEGSGVEHRVPLAIAPKDAEGARPREATVRGVLELEKLQVQPADRVVYWIEAADTRAAGRGLQALEASERGRSQRYTLRILSHAEMERVLQGRIKRLREQLEQVRRTEEGVGKELAELLEALPSGGGPIERAARRRLTYVELDQRRVVQRLGRAASEADGIAADMESNGVGSDKDTAWLREIGDALRELGDEPAERVIADLRKQRERDEVDREALQQAREGAEAVVARLEELIRRLDKWDEFNEILREMRELLERAERVTNRTRARAKAELGR